MESSSSSRPPRKLEVSMSSLVSEPILDIDSATLEVSLPDDAVRPAIPHNDSCNSHDWEYREKFESFNDHDSITDSLFSNNILSQHTDPLCLSDATSFQETSIDEYPTEISNDDHLAQLVKNAKSKNMVQNLELNKSSARENMDFNQNSNATKTSLNLSVNDNEASCFSACQHAMSNNENPSEENAQPLQAHPEYTENFHNYKLCRVIAPGVKECLILETGEQIKCDKRKKLEAEEKLAKSVSQVENSSLSALSSPPPHPQSPPPLSLSSDITDHSAPTMTTIKLDYDCLNKSQASVSSDKENCDISPCPQPSRENKEAGNDPYNSPLRQKQVTVDSTDESSTDFLGQEKLSKKVFKITKPHAEDSAVYFGNLRLGRGINKGCPRSFILGSCLKNKMSIETNSKVEGEKKSEEKKENRDPSANVDVITDGEEPANPVEPLMVKTPLISSWKDLNLNDVNSLSPTGYYSDPCQAKGTSWTRHLELSPVDIGKSSEELRREDGPQQSLAGKEWCRTIANKRESASPQRAEIPQVVTVMDASNNAADGSKLTPSESGPVPNFKSLQERQVTWMLHQLEEQHLQSMKHQYEQHQRNIQRIQEDMEAEILNQQASFEEKIKTKKNALIKEAFGPSRSPHMFLHPNRNNPNFNSYDADIDLSDSEESEDDMSPGIAPENKPKFFGMAPINKHQSQESETSSKFSPVSMRREPFSGLTHHLDLPGVDSELITDGRVLQGGVYATPFPLSKSTLLLKSPSTVTDKCSKPPSLATNTSFSSVLGDEVKSEAALLLELEQRHQQRMQQRQMSPARNFDQLSDDPLTDILNDSQGNLREKHAKHLSDLRLYYEKEIKELRDALSHTESVGNRNAYKKLVEENLLLTKKCQDKEEQLSKQKARDYEEQIRTYQSQLKTYSQRCTELEKLLNDFKHQLYQETAHNHRKEARLKDLETDLLKKNKAIEEIVKLRDEILEDNEQKQATIQKLVTRYEKLEKESKILKESLSVAEERYFEANAEILYVKRENARLDFDNKRFMRENENLRQKIGTFKFYGDEDSGSLNNANVNNSASKSLRSSQRNLSSQTRLDAECDLMKEVSGKEILEAFENQFTSPIMAAERELRKLRSSSKKFSGKSTNSVTDIDHLPEGIFVDLPLSVTSRPKAKTNQRQLTKDVKSKSNSSMGHHVAIETSKLSGKSKVPFQTKEVNTSARCDIRLNDVSNSLAKDHQQPTSLQQDKSNNAGSSDKSVESKPSQMSFQPQIEDLYSSLTKVQNQLESSSISKTQQKFQVTLETIKKLENRYDGLQAEKVQLEAALSRIPMSGRVDRKARQKKEDLEKKLDAVERELGSVRMSLKKFNVLKSSI